MTIDDLYEKFLEAQRERLGPEVLQIEDNIKVRFHIEQWADYHKDGSHLGDDLQRVKCAVTAAIWRHACDNGLASAMLFKLSLPPCP